MRTFAVITATLVCFVAATSQQLTDQTRAQQIAASFNKHKNVVKEKHGIRMEKYKDVRSEPVVKQNTRDYSGEYEVSGLGFVINIEIGNEGRVQAHGQENTSHSFTLANAKIEGALLTGTKVYQNGTREKFEGVFMMRMERNSPSDNGVSSFGLGVILGTPVELNGITYERLFYQLKQ